MKKSILYFIFIIFAIGSLFNGAFAKDNYLNELERVGPFPFKKIKVWIEPSPYKDTVYQAIGEWKIAANNCISFYEANTPGTAHIRIYFVDSLPGTAVGITKYQYGYREIFVLKTYKDSKVKLSAKSIYPVILHEFGHALGLMGHSSDRNDVMFPNTDIVGIHTSYRDFNSIQALYCK